MGRYRSCDVNGWWWCRALVFHAASALGRAASVVPTVGKSELLK